jgi:hypothetical protein
MDQYQNLKEKVDKLEDRVAVVEKDQTETKVYVKQIFGILDDLKLSSKNQITKDDLFRFLAEQNKSNSTNIASWQKWTLVVIGGTLFVVIGYLFGK